MSLPLPFAVPIDSSIEEMADGNSLEDRIIGDIAFLDFLSILSFQDKVIALLLTLGYSQHDAARVLGVSDGYISQRLNIIRLLSKVLSV